MAECTTCNIPSKCDPQASPIQQTGDCLVVNDAQLESNKIQDTASKLYDCVDGKSCPPVNVDCLPLDLSKFNDSCVVETAIQEQINISGAPVNIYKLLGIHEQRSGTTVDFDGVGAAISSSVNPNFPASNAFDIYVSEWRSLETGPSVINSYIGYDFGPIKLDNGRLRYGIETYIKKDISTIKIKQSCNAKNRATKLRVERSSDGVKWYGVAVVDVQDCDGLVTVKFKKTVPSRWWRVRPVAFNGGVNDNWIVQAIIFSEDDITDIKNIQDRIFFENRDRDYTSPIPMKVSYTPIDVRSEVNKGAFNFSNNYIIETSFRDTVQKLGRPFVIGDIIHLIPETQYNAAMNEINKFVEVVDVAWSTNGYTANWKPTMQRLECATAFASQETQDVFGSLEANIDAQGVFDVDDGNNQTYQDISSLSQTIEAQANTGLPQDGIDNSETLVISKDMVEYGETTGVPVNKLEMRRAPFGQDALPPNGLPYTEADSFPPSPTDGDYHRLTYALLGNNIPPRLYKFSSVKNRWIFMETDNKFKFRNNKSIITEFVESENKSTQDVGFID